MERQNLLSAMINSAALCACALLLSCALPSRVAYAQRIRVDDNVLVSRDRPGFSHHEVWLAIDPADPGRQLAAAMAVSAERPDQISTFVYASRDGGRTWRLTLDTGPLTALAADPSCAFGTDGAAHYAVALCAEFAERCRLSAFRSVDGGLTWGPPLDLPLSRGVDRPWVAVDSTGGKYRGRVYVMSQIVPRTTAGERLLSAITLHRSLDGGLTFGPPALKSAPTSNPAFHPGNTVVTPDGTVVGAFREFTRTPAADEEDRRIKDVPGEKNSFIRVITSDDGGDTLSQATTVAESALRWPPFDISSFPYLAVDRASAHFAGRLYAAWTDTGSGRSRVMFSYSADGGKKWSAPQAVDDGAAPDKGGPDAFLPAVAVNPAGVVGVSWYDRREDPAGYGWHVRFSASLDGGDTFGPSVRVSSVSNSFGGERWAVGGQSVPPRGVRGSPLDLVIYLNPSAFSGGHTAGMEADGAGVFRPVWVDNRTGELQVWTAGVTVEGEVLPNGSRELSAYRDVSDRVIVEFTSVNYDPATDVVTAEARLRNISGETLRGPVKLRALTLTSQLAARAEVTNADNGAGGPGAVWDFTAQLKDNQLKPGEASAVRSLTFKLTGRLPLKEGHAFRNRLASFRARVLSGAPAPQPPARAPGGAR